MTFQEAQSRFADIVGSITPEFTSRQIVEKKRQLRTLLASLPASSEFDPLANAINDLMPKLTGRVTRIVLEDLQARTASLQQAGEMLTRAATEANADARTLRLEQPKLVAAALTNSLDTLREIREAARAGNFTEAAVKAQALLDFLEQVRATIKPA